MKPSKTQTLYENRNKAWDNFRDLQIYYNYLLTFDKLSNVVSSAISESKFTVMSKVEENESPHR